MAYPRRLLSADEEVVHELHPHWKVLVGPALWFVLAALVLGFGLAVMPSGQYQGQGRIAVVVVVGLFVVWRCVLPLLRWRTTLFVLTTERLITRSGILARSGRDIPYSRVNDVSFTHSALERVLGCGTLVVESAGERGQVMLTGIPHVERIQRELYTLSEDDDAYRRRGDRAWNHRDGEPEDEADDDHGTGDDRGRRDR